MPYDLSKKFVIGISARALFDMSEENAFFEAYGPARYEQRQRQYENECLRPGVGFPLIKSMLALNKHLPSDRQIEVVLFTRNAPAAGIRLRRSIDSHAVSISRYVMTSGDPVWPYLTAFKTDLFLSADRADVAAAHGAGVASALIWGLPKSSEIPAEDSIRIAFDGDAVLFSEESEKVYQDSGLEAFHSHEAKRAREPLRQGPFAKVLLSLAYLQRILPPQQQLLKTGLITARNSPADERVMQTLRAWGISIDHLVFLGGIEKAAAVDAFSPHIFFDDQAVHCSPVSRLVPTAQVPSTLNAIESDAAPPCPKCAGQTVRKIARHGKRCGSPFYSCKNYPLCKGAVDIP